MKQAIQNRINQWEHIYQLTREQDLDGLTAAMMAPDPICEAACQDCTNCPVLKHTGKWLCQDTPHWEAEKIFRALKHTSDWKAASRIALEQFLFLNELNRQKAEL